MKQTLKVISICLLPALVSIPMFVIYFMLMWADQQALIMVISVYMLACWALLHAKVLKKKQDAVKKFVLLNGVPFGMAFLGSVTTLIPKYETLSIISMEYYQAIWPLMILCASKIDTRVTAYYGSTTWTVYIIGLGMMLLAGILGIGIKYKLLNNQEVGNQ